MIKRLTPQFSKLSGSIPLAILWLLMSFYYLYIGFRVFIFPLSIPAVSLQRLPSLPQQEQIQISPLIPLPPSLISEELIYQPGLETILATIIITSIFFLFGLFTLGLFVPKKILKVVVSILSIVLAAEFTPVYNSVVGTYSEVVSPAGILVSILFAFWNRSYLSSFLVAVFSTTLIAQPIFYISHYIYQTIEQGFFNYWGSTLSNLNLQITPSFILSLVIFSPIFSLPATLTVFLLHHWQKISNLPVLSNRLARYIFIAVLISPLIYLFVTQPFIYRFSSPLPPTLPSSLDESQTQTLEVYVVDAITKQPIEKASVVIGEIVNCPEVEGYSCPEGLSWKKEANKEGKAVFTDQSLKEYIEKNLVEKDSYFHFSMTASAPNYKSEGRDLIYSYIQPPEGVYYPNDKNTFYSFKGETFTIELIGGNIAVKTREDAITYVKKDKRVAEWLVDHPEGETTKAGVTFEAPYWTITYTNKICAYSGSQLGDCSISLKIDARDGKIVGVSTD